MRKVFGYIRVSTPKQGSGVSLQEQKDAITRYCQRNALEIVSWFEERETAAKRGRPIFTQILEELRRGKAQGMVIHKIDRSARNLKDWADLGELIDQGVEVHFANDSLDLHSRGGRLSADIQAVVAADYIRNLREETKKGFYGRIKQGLYPLPAPIGYLDKGKGQPKEVDPVKAPLVRKAFEMYSTGSYNLHTLSYELFRLGLRNRGGKKLTISGVSHLLNNPFYIGLIRLKKTNEVFPGSHPPIISKSMFDRVQAILTGKTNTRSQKHNFVFRRMLTCAHCSYSLIGELQKGHVYYRCQKKDCPTTCVREETVELEVIQRLLCLQFTEKERLYVKQKVERLKANWKDEQEELIKTMQLRLGNVQDLLDRLTDAYLEQVIDKDVFERRKNKLLMEQKEIEEKLVDLIASNQSIPDRLAEFLELADSAYLQYYFALPEEKRDMVKNITSNRTVEGKKLSITLSSPFSEVANRFQNSNGAPYRDIPRTWDTLLAHLVEIFRSNLGTVSRAKPEYK